MKGKLILRNSVRTPAYLIDKNILESDLEYIRSIADQASCKLLYSPKACSLTSVLETVSNYVDGFACSSLFELKLTDIIRKERSALHLVSPLIFPDVFQELGERLGYLTVNSIAQWERLRGKVSRSTNVGFRINPQISLVRDERYDPCKPNSKLGIPIDKLAKLSTANPDLIAGVNGLHFHTNCDDPDFASLLATARHVRDVIPHVLEKVEWINMGGGYLFHEAENLQDFFEAVSLFREDFGLDVFVEPGTAISRRAGTVEATVHDLIDSEDLQIAVLDTTVNHMPEVFEFQFEPDVLGHVEGGAHSYILAGCTCLAGDAFGEYAFDTPLRIGSRITFLNMGAYTSTKAHRFNGVALPSIYTQRGNDAPILVMEDSFDDFARYLGVHSREIV